MGKCIVVTDFGLGRTKIGAYKKEGGKFVLYSGAIFDTPEGGFSEPETLQMFSASLDKMAVKSGDLLVSLPVDEKNIVCTEADYPLGNAKEVANIVKNNLGGIVPDEAEQFTADWRLLESYSSGQGKFQIAAVKTSCMETLQEIAEKKHFVLKRADLSINAVENLVGLIRSDAKYGLNSTSDAAAIVDVGHKSAKIIVFTKERCVRSETVSHNLYRLDKIINSTLGDLKNDPGIIPETLKLNPSYTGKITQYNGFLSSLTTDIIRVIKQSVSGEYRYQLSGIYFTGGLFKMPQLVSTVKDTFNVPCFAFPIDDFLQVNSNCISHANKRVYPSPDVFAASLGMLIGGAK